MTEKPKAITDQKTLKLMVIVDPYLYQSIKVGYLIEYLQLSNFSTMQVDLFNIHLYQRIKKRDF